MNDRATSVLLVLMGGCVGWVLSGLVWWLWQVAG
jgi:hypothetical protein